MSTLPTTTPVSGNISAFVSNTGNEFWTVAITLEVAVPLFASVTTTLHSMDSDGFTKLGSSCNVDELVVDEVAVSTDPVVVFVQAKA